MRQSYWDFAANLWALAVSTTVALFLPDFGPQERMADGVGVVIRTTMAAPVVFTLMYWVGRLITLLAPRWLMNLLMLGIQHGIQNAAERRAKELAKEIAEQAAKDAAKSARESEREQFRRFMRVKGFAEHEIDAFFRQLPNQN